MKFFFTLIFIPFILACGNVSYLIQQGIGQLNLQRSGRPNEKVLKDPNVPQAAKEKIQKIQKYKRFFYNYFDRKPEKIYEKTVFLKTKAVTHLVVSSKYDEIKPIKHCFLIKGCFPYLGFFKEKKAIQCQQKLEKKGNYTFRRPVYAYSTLGHFTDHILSSFFHYDEKKLAELIFHELFHTIFFVKDEVDLNENLAQYFGLQLAIEFFKDKSKDWIEDKKRSQAKQKVMRRKIVELTRLYRLQLKDDPPSSREESDRRLSTFMKNTFVPAIRSICQKQKRPTCYVAEKKWNNASLSAYLTYEDKLEIIENHHRSQGSSLRDYFKYIEEKYKSYKGDNFKSVLFSEKKKNETPSLY